MGIQIWSEDIFFVDLPKEPEMSNELEVLIKQIAAESKNVVLDFSNVDVIRASSISKLLKLRKLLNDQKRRLILCNVAPATKCIFMVTGLDETFEFADNKFVALTQDNLAS